MKRFALSLFLAVSCLGPPMLVGCDKTVSEETSRKERSDGTVVTDKEKKTVNTETGDVTKTTEHKVDKP